MKTAGVVLAVVEAAKTVPGKTVLQKICYFANEAAHGGMEFGPLYYGPFSGEVSDAMSDLVGTGYLSEATERGSLAVPRRTLGGDLVTEWQRYNYALTDEGKTYFKSILAKRGKDVDRLRDLVKKLRDLTGFETAKLANAAKVHYVMKNEKALKPAAIIDAAKRQGWRLSEDEVTAAIDVLRELGLWSGS